MQIDAGLSAIDEEDQKLAKDGVISKEDAEHIAVKVKKDHPIFKSITVVGGEGSWDYEYVGSGGKKKGPKQKEGGQAENWIEVQKILNKKAGIPLPAHYSYYEREKRKFIRRDEDDDRKYVPLTVNDAGLIIVGSASSERISDPAEVSKSIGKPTDDSQRHHLVPDAVVRRHALCREAMDRGKPAYSLDSASNLIRLPSAEEYKPKYPGLPVHNTSHPRWSAYATTLLDNELGILREEFGGFAKVPAEELTKAVKRVEGTLRTEIKTWDKLD
jgi:hypothetical protein